MSRFVLTTPVTIAGTDYAHPPRKHKKGDVVELSAAEVTAIGGGNLRAVVATAGSATHTHDTLGESFAVSNSNP